jgi:itaconate CoA-transferase
LVFSIQNEPEWQRFCTQVLELPQLAQNPEYAGNNNRLTRRDALNAQIEQVFTGLTRVQLSGRFAAAQLAYASVNDLAGLLRHPALRRVLQPVPGAEVQMSAPPVQANGRTLERYQPIPQLGQHSEALRAEFARGE